METLCDTLSVLQGQTMKNIRSLLKILILSVLCKLYVVIVYVYIFYVLEKQLFKD